MTDNKNDELESVSTNNDTSEQPDGDAQSLLDSVELLAVNDVGDAATPTSEPQENAWLPGAKMVTAFLRGNSPNWDWPEEMVEQFEVGCAECADQLMPGGLGNIDKWGCWAKLAFASGAIATANFNFEKMEFQPLHKPTKQVETD